MTCNICYSRLLPHCKQIKCSVCCSIYHLNCITLNKADQDYFLLLNDWVCCQCRSEIFPFVNIDDDEIYDECVCHFSHSTARDSIFTPFELNENNRELAIDDADPDLNYYQEINHILTSKCNYYHEESFNKELVQTNITQLNNFSMCHVNIRSAKKNLSDFATYLSLLKHNFSVIGLSETWLNDENSDLYDIDGFTFEPICRQNRSGGGVAICVKRGISYIVRKDLCFSDELLESVFIELAGDSSKFSNNIVLAVIYRPPNTNMNLFNEKMIAILDILKKEKKICYLLGDFNIDCFKAEHHKNTADFLNVMYSHSYIPLITRPTRVTSKSATLIDNIYTNNLKHLQNTLSGLLITDISDHYPVFHIHPVSIEKETDVFFWKRCLNTVNKLKFRDMVSNEDWAEILNNGDTKSAFTSFHSKIKTIYDCAFPKIKVKIRYNNRKPWLTDDLKEAIKNKNKLFIKTKKHPSAFNEVNYMESRNKLTHELRKAEKKHYNDLIEINKHNIKKTWNVLKNIINKNKVRKTQTKFKLSNDQVTSDNHVISEKFNDFFVNIGPNLAKSLKTTDTTPQFYLKQPLFNFLTLDPVTESELHLIFTSLKNAAPGYDEIKIEPLKLVLEFIAEPLSYLCNLSFNQGIFPAELKIANVIPLYKKDDSMLFSNYRPVSLLCSLSKVFEKVMCNRVVSFLETYKILYEYQFGFRKDHSTYLAIMSLLDRITKCLENGDYIIGVFLDFSKAFDTVDHSILLLKLFHYGIRGNALKWFESYLGNRQQYVTYNGVSSSMKFVKCGVPQGSILGPILFLLYINDLASICTNVFSIFFADDSNIFKNGKDLIKLQETINSELKEISKWLNVNKLFMNISKTQYMVFSGKKMEDNVVNLHIDQKLLKRVFKSKFLGVIIDDKLTFKDHIAHISSKMSKGIGIICKARAVLKKDSLLTLYYALVYPHISYCNQIWGNISANAMHKLITLQKRAIRIICGVHPRTHTAPLFKESRILNLEQINKFLVGQMMYKFQRGEIPRVFDNFFTFNRDIHQHYTRIMNNIHIPKVKTELRKRSLAFWGAKLWNSILTTNISLVVTPITFKYSLKKLLLNDKV